MAQLNFALLCSRSIVDHATNLLSLIDIIDAITFNRPHDVPDDGLDLVIEFSRSQPSTPETLYVRVVVQDPRGISIGNFRLANGCKVSGVYKACGFAVFGSGQLHPGHTIPRTGR